MHHNKLIISHIKQTNIRYSAAHLWFMSWTLPDKNYVFIIFQISAHCIYWEERLALEYFPTLVPVKIDFFLFSCYRHLPHVHGTACSTICLQEENCVAVQYTPRMLGIQIWKGCKLFGMRCIFFGKITQTHFGRRATYRRRFLWNKYGIWGDCRNRTHGHLLRICLRMKFCIAKSTRYCCIRSRRPTARRPYVSRFAISMMH